MALGLGVLVMGSINGAPKGYPYGIVATTGMVADLVRHVGGDRVEVEALMGEGVDPHLYNPTRDDALKLMRADVIFYNGLHLEGRMTELFNKMERKGVPVIAVAGVLAKEFLLPDQEIDGAPDPHVWMDVSAWEKALGEVQRGLSAYDPEHAAEYAANAKVYRERLRALDEYIRETMGTIPKGQRVLVTAHDAFHYFSRAYGIEVMGVQGLSTESEAGVSDINRLVDFLVKRKIPAVFVESSVSDKNVRAVVEGARSRGHEVVIGGQLFSDAMGASGTYEGTYLGMLDHNATVIAKGLGGKPPERGMEGKLR